MHIQVFGTNTTQALVSVCLLITFTLILTSSATAQSPEFTTIDVPGSISPWPRTLTQKVTLWASTPWPRRDARLSP